MRRSGSILFVLALSWSAVARADRAADEKQARALHAEGVRRYNLAEYDKAIDAFRRAYELAQFPGLLFNIAQAYRQQRDCGQALEFYRSYIRQKPDASDRAQVDALVVEMEACLAASQSAPTPPAPRPNSAAPTAPARDSRPLPWVLGGVALAATATGGGLLGYVDHAVDACAPRCSAERIGKLRATSTWGYGLVAGGAVAGIAAVIVAVVQRGRESEARVALVPDAAGLSIVGRF
jgi:tetratricopeptide (TPR) repeat protein